MSEQRPIKFRAWHKAEKRMFDVYDLSWFSGIFLIGDEQSWDKGKYGSGEVSLMQFTGLKDSQRRDIYEGDILELNGAIAKVVYWTNPPEFGLDYCYRNEDEWCDDWNLSDDSERMVIIGNIHEHPHLLQGV